MIQLYNSFNELREALAGKKTYIISILAGILGTLKLMGYPIPPWIWPILGAFDFAAVKAAVDKWKPINEGE